MTTNIAVHQVLSTLIEGLKHLLVLACGLILAIGSKPFMHWIGTLVNPKWNDLIQTLEYGFEHLGVVLVVAWVVRVAIENASQRQFLDVVNNKVREQIQKSIDKIAVDSIAPLEVSIKKLDEELGFKIRTPGLLDKDSLEILKKKVLSPNFIRSEYKVLLTLERLTAPASSELAGEYLKVRVRTAFKVKNITEMPQKYVLKGWLDYLFEPEGLDPLDQCQFTSCVYGPEDSTSENDLRPFDLAKMKNQGKIKREHGAVWLEHEPHSGVPPGATYYVELEALQVMRMADVFVWTISELTQRLIVQIQFGEGFTPADFQVNARELHHVGREQFRATRNDDNGISTWKIDQVLLPHQGVQVWWHPARAASATSGVILE